MLNDALGFCSVCQKWLDDKEFKMHPGKCSEHHDDDLQELKEYLETMRGQCILGQDCADLDVHDMTVLLGLIEKYKKSQREIAHWKKAFESENKIAGKLRKIVERYEKALKSERDSR